MIWIKVSIGLGSLERNRNIAISILKNLWTKNSNYYSLAIQLLKTISPRCLWVKSVQKWIFFWSVCSCIWTEYRKIRTGRNSVFGHFHVVAFHMIHNYLHGLCWCFAMHPTNTPRVFQVETTWKRPFPRRFNVEYTWCACRVTTSNY